MFRSIRNGLMLGCVLLLSACVSNPPFSVPIMPEPVTLDPVFMDHMVLQRGMPVHIWGKANPGEPVRVLFADEMVRATADTTGNWSAMLPSLKASAEPRKLVVQGHNEAAIEDVLVGEVWLCSGQSNMEWGLMGVSSGKKDCEAANLPLLRLFSVDKVQTNSPLAAFKGTKGWFACSPETLTQVGTHSKSFSATAFYFGRDLQAKLNVPVGLIQSAWGGTRIEPWTPQKKSGNKGGFIYNAMIAPMTPMTIRGAIWYQGEANRGDKGAYEQKMKDLISTWREVFARPDMPFYFVEIAPFRYGKNDPEALGELRAAQARVAATVPNTGMIHTLDNPSDLGNIHPDNKPQIGARLARLALEETYGIELGESVTGPVFKSAKLKNGAILIKFEDTADALVTSDNKAPTGFEAQVADAGPNAPWVKAEAAIQGDRVSVTVPGKVPVAVRFCWLETDQTNLRNAEGLPPSPFLATLAR